MFISQGNGLDERYNQTLQRMLVKFVHHKKEVWDDFLDSSVYAYNTAVHESSGFTPFDLMLGRKALLPVDVVSCQTPHEVLLDCMVEEDNFKRLTRSQLAILRSYGKQRKHQKRTGKAKAAIRCKACTPEHFSCWAKGLKKGFHKEEKSSKEDGCTLHWPLLHHKATGERIIQFARSSRSKGNHSQSLRCIPEGLQGRI